MGPICKLSTWWPRPTIGSFLPSPSLTICSPVHSPPTFLIPDNPIALQLTLQNHTLTLLWLLLCIIISPSPIHSLYYYLSPSPIHLTFVTKTDVWRTLASHISSLYCFSFDHNLTPNSTTLRSPSSKRLALLSPAHFSVPVDLIASLWRHYLLPTEKYKATERQRTGFYHSL
jgi:hypothetical protein